MSLTSLTSLASLTSLTSLASLASLTSLTSTSPYAPPGRSRSLSQSRHLFDNGLKVARIFRMMRIQEISDVSQLRQTQGDVALAMEKPLCLRASALDLRSCRRCEGLVFKYKERCEEKEDSKMCMSFSKMPIARGQSQTQGNRANLSRVG
eukprot:s2942_g1.t1